MVIAFNKPSGIRLEEWASSAGRSRKSVSPVFPPEVRPLGILDPESEGLVLLSDEAAVRDRPIAPEVYWVQVERPPSEINLKRLLKAGGAQLLAATEHSRAWLLAVEPDVEPRPTGARRRPPAVTSWIGLILPTVDSQQIWKQAAALGHPPLRVIRVQLGNFPLGDLPTGQWRILEAAEQRRVLGTETALGSPWRFPKSHAHAGLGPAPTAP